MTTDTLLVFPCFLEAWTEINVLTITNSSSLRLRKLACHQQQPLKTILVIRMANHPLHPISHCQPQPSSQEGKTFIQPSVLRMYYLPRDQQFHLGFNRTAFLPVHFYISECEYVCTHFVSIFLCFPLLHPSVLPKAQQSDSPTHFQLPGQCTIC